LVNEPNTAAGRLEQDESVSSRTAMTVLLIGFIVAEGFLILNFCLISHIYVSGQEF